MSSFPRLLLVRCVPSWEFSLKVRKGKQSQNSWIKCIKVVGYSGFFHTRGISYLYIKDSLLLISKFCYCFLPWGKTSHDTIITANRKKLIKLLLQKFPLFIVLDMFLIFHWNDKFLNHIIIHCFHLISITHCSSLWKIFLCGYLLTLFSKLPMGE